ncbi:MAG: tetratricopeptide repeat protein [Anaerolineae bacterium]|nr:tetratricopeptide repeat protein [Anaerolineae bacterium]
MRTLTSAGLLILIVIVVLGGGPGTPRNATAQDDTPVPAHLVLSVDNGSDARLNRMDWDVNAWAPLFPAASVRSSDYIDLLGRTTVLILCTDLTLIDQRGSEVPRCEPYPEKTFFVYADNPTWTGPEGAVTIVVTDPNPATFPAEIRNPGAYNLDELIGDELAAIMERTDVILGLDIAPEAQAFALSSFYRSQGMIFDAIGALTALPDLGCTDRRPFVEPPGEGERPLVQSPAVYLRLGEMFQIIGQNEDALRNYRCAAELAQSVGDTADTALAFARQGNIAEDPAEAIQFYQVSIDSYASLGAYDVANAIMEICGSRNCTLDIPGE